MTYYENLKSKNNIVIDKSLEDNSFQEEVDMIIKKNNNNLNKFRFKSLSLQKT